MADNNNDGRPDALFNADGSHTGLQAPLENFPDDWSGQRRDAMDPYWYGLETGGIEESYGGGTYDSVIGAVYAWERYNTPVGTKWRDSSLYNPTHLGWQGNDQPWDNECEVAAELQCNYVPPAASRMIQTRILFSGTVETFPVGRLQTNFAYAIDVPVQDVEVYVQPGSVSANIRVAAAENNLVYVQNRMVAVVANVSHASAKIGFPVEQIVEMPLVQHQSPNAPPCHPATRLRRPGRPNRPRRRRRRPQTPCTTGRSTSGATRRRSTRTRSSPPRRLRCARARLPSMRRCPPTGPGSAALTRACAARGRSCRASSSASTATCLRPTTR